MTRRRERKRIAALDPQTDFHEIFRNMATQELGWEHRFGLSFAFYRIFAVPRMAKLLAYTGHIQARPVKRMYDTGLLMYDLSYHGPEHPRGREVIRKLNTMHRRWQIENEDYLYVLASLVVVPIRFMDEYGWRRATAQEREANVLFYRRVGELMAIRDSPSTESEFEQFFDEYESRHLAPSDDGRSLMDATKPVAEDWFAGPLTFLADPFTRVLLGEHLSRCLGQQAAPFWARALVRAALTARAVALCVAPILRIPLITPEDPIGPYEGGYAMADLGVDSATADPERGHGSSQFDSAVRSSCRETP